jgi:hypothetical protein
MTGPVDIWKKHALQWSKVGPPLRPAPQDIAIMERCITKHFGCNKCLTPRAILLGVTPEIATMRWPSGTRLIALDRNWAMIENVWPGKRVTGLAATCGDWTAMPIMQNSCDVVVGDGCCTTLSYPEGYNRVSLEVSTILKRCGVLVMRFYVSPPNRETTASVFEDLWAGRIGSFHVFKWRLAMAVHRTADSGVRLRDVWDAWHADVPDPVDLALKLNWSLETISTIDPHRDMDVRYTFPTLEELQNVLRSHFSEEGCFFPDYELGERCPIMVLRPL